MKKSVRERIDNMNSLTNDNKLKLTDDEIKLLEVFRNIPQLKQNEAIIKLYILAENSFSENKI